MEDIKLNAKKRSLGGSSNSRRMRNLGTLPGVIYGSNRDPVSIQVNLHEFEEILHHHTSESLIIEITLEGEGNMSVLVKEVQHHPVTSQLMHVDLQCIDADKPIHLDITVELVGEAKGVKAGGILDHVMHAITVECLPADLVECFEVNVSALEIGQSLQVSDLNLGDKYEVLEDDDAIVAAVSAPRVEEEEEEAEEEGVTEPELISEKREEDAD